MKCSSKSPCADHTREVSNDDPDAEEESDDNVPPVPVLKSYSEAIQVLVDIWSTKDIQVNQLKVYIIMTLINTLTILHYSTLSTRCRQATLKEFFPGVPAVQSDQLSFHFIILCTMYFVSFY